MKTIVAFDFDGTLTKKDSFIEFVKHSKGIAAFIFSLPILAYFWISVQLRLITLDKAKEKIFKYFFKGMPLKEFNYKCEEFSNRIDQFLRDEAKKTISNFNKPDCKKIIVSASIENWIEPWARENGFNNVIATQIEVNDSGVLTGCFLSKNCKGKEKVSRILKIFPERESYQLISFGNSKGDKELIEFSNKGYMNAIK